MSRNVVQIATLRLTGPKAVPLTGSLFNALVDLGWDTTGGHRERRPNPFKPANIPFAIKDWYLNILEEKAITRNAIKLDQMEQQQR